MKAFGWPIFIPTFPLTKVTTTTHKGVVEMFVTVDGGTWPSLWEIYPFTRLFSLQTDFYLII